MSLIMTPLEKALELDNTLEEAHSALADHRCWREWDWEGAEKEYQEALRLNPSYAGAHQGYSLLLCIMGRAEEALPHIELAVKLNPLEPMMHHFYAMVLIYHRRYDDAIAAYRAALEIAPNLGFTLSGLAGAPSTKGMYDEALAIYRRVYADDAELTNVLEDGVEYI
jgi:tetratricopeptide (TPR) repeat protein